jgi:Putative transcriptional repressor regulating G2/M transition
MQVDEYININYLLMNNINYMREDTNFNEEVFNERRFQCKKCGSAYKNKTHLYRHMKHECDVEPHFHCPYCQKNYKRKDKLRSHMLKFHCELLTV